MLLNFGVKVGKVYNLQSLQKLEFFFEKLKNHRTHIMTTQIQNTHVLNLRGEMLCDFFYIFSTFLIMKMRRDPVEIKSVGCPFQS